MSIVKIYGHSDDTLEIEGDFVGEQDFGCYDKFISIKVEDSKSPRRGVVVTAKYAYENRSAVWMIGVEPLDEDVPMPYMKYEMAPSGYSPMLVLEFGDKPTVSVVE